MYRSFTIDDGPRVHGLFKTKGYDQSHPSLYRVKDPKTQRQAYLISRHDNYQVGQTITIEVGLIRHAGSSSYYIDQSSLHALATPSPVANSSKGKIDSDVILMVEAVEKTPDNKTRVTGHLFYADPALKNLQDSGLRAAFKEGAAMEVVSHNDTASFILGNTFIFNRLSNITIANGKILGSHTPEFQF